MSEKSLGVYTVVPAVHANYPSFSPFSITSTTLPHPPSVSRPSIPFAPSSSPTPFSVSPPRRTPALSPSPSTALSAPFHAPSRSHRSSLSLPPSWALSVRFHPRPSTFRVYRTIARAPITVTGRATSWLAVDVGGGRTADRRRRGRRRRRRRRRGRAQQTISETRRATERNSSPADGVISRSRNVPEEACALCCCLQRSQNPPRKPSIRESTRGDSTGAASRYRSKPQRNAGLKFEEAYRNKSGRLALTKNIVGGIDSQRSTIKVSIFRKIRTFGS